MSKQVAIFGAGDYGRVAIASNKAAGTEVVCIIDNDPKKWGVLDDIAVISFDEFCRKYNGVEVIIAVGDKYYPEIKKQVGEAGIAYRRSNAENEIFRKERLLSYRVDE